MWEPGQYSIFFNKVERVLDEIRPAMRKDGGDCDLVEITPDGVVKLRLLGACGKCPMSFMTLSMGIETKIKASIPEVQKVVAIEGGACSSESVSPPGAHSVSSPGTQGGSSLGLLQIRKAINKILH
jgi:Fe-S cluster biogenesis protein NfuA